MTQQLQNQDEPLFKSAFDYEVGTELGEYGQNALALFALSLYLRIDDIHAFAADAITEGADDKKVDIFYLDTSENRAIITQNYYSQNWGRPAALANKAADLTNAMAWLLSTDEDRIPEAMRPRATELRNALREGTVTKIDILYIHNCYESDNVKNELRTVGDATRDLVRALVGDLESQVIISCIELGLEGIEELYDARESDILIKDWLDVPSSSQYVEEETTQWKAILTTVSGQWIRDLYLHYDKRLFSANYRDYLGTTKRKGNINQQITKTADSEPTNFWVYNNGITALTYELQVRPTVRIRGISVINGAQTTGALSDAAEQSTEDIKVLIRIVECSEHDMIRHIIQYNNTQNEIKPVDMRSNDDTQNRLRREFENYGITYVHRRSDLRIPRNAITATAVAAALSAFHGEPQTAYRNAPDIFVNESMYRKFFTATISVEHIFLVRALSTALDKLKNELKEKTTAGNATEQEQLQYDALKFTATKHFIFYVVGELREGIMGRRVSDLFEWKCKKGIISPENHSMSDAWMVALRALLPQIIHVLQEQDKNAFYEVPRSAELSKQVAIQLKTNIASLGPMLEPQFREVRRRTTV